MPRPQTDIEAGREKLIVVAEKYIRENGAVNFTVTDLAAEAGMSQSNVYRFFESKDALAEAMAGRWFAELTTIMEQLVEADMPVRDKLYQFFARRLELKRARFNEDPDLFRSYMELGNQYFDVIRGYVDLGDHYMASILAEAIDEGYFRGIPLDDAVSLVNLMIQPFCNANLMKDLMHIADERRLRMVIDTILDGARSRNDNISAKPQLQFAQ